jgi:hypothetical protein
MIWEYFRESLNQKICMKFREENQEGIELTEEKQLINDMHNRIYWYVCDQILNLDVEYEQFLVIFLPENTFSVKHRWYVKYKL